MRVLMLIPFYDSSVQSGIKIDTEKVLDYRQVVQTIDGVRLLWSSDTRFTGHNALAAAPRHHPNAFIALEYVLCFCL